MSNTNKGEVAKLQQHLSLLKEQYVKLQKQLGEVERKYSLAAAASGQINEHSFVSRLLEHVAGLFEQELFSDMKIKLDGRTLPAHRFVLSAQSEQWSSTALADSDMLDWSKLQPEVGTVLLRWLYTNQADFSRGDDFTLALMRTANGFQLIDLVSKCEKALMASVSVKNCVRFYTTADEIHADTLKEFCSGLISTHWDEFSSEDFAHMNAQLLFRMLKAKTGFPLHSAIRLQRDDVVFLYLVENNADLADCLNRLDDKGELPLGMALRDQQAGIACTLVENHADLDARDNQRWTLLHRAVQRCDAYAADFLLQHGCSVATVTPDLGNTALHLIATNSPDTATEDTLVAMATIAALLLDQGLDADLQNNQGYTALHLAVMADNDAVFRLLLEHGADLDLHTAEHHSALWFSLLRRTSFDADSFAARLIQHKANPNPVYPGTGDTLLHVTAREGLEPAASFLASHASNVSAANLSGETCLHVACQRGLDKLAGLLLQRGCDPNVQTSRRDDKQVYKRAALHEAIVAGHERVVEAFIAHAAANARPSTCPILNLNLKDSAGNTALSLALSHGSRHVIGRLIAAGADVNARNGRGYTLLHQSIVERDEDSALFLLESGADMSAVSADNETALQLAIAGRLSAVVEALCRRGVDMSVKDSDNCCPLWMALSLAEQDIASILVRYGVDTDCWDSGPDGCYQTLLHRAIDLNNQPVAQFLVQSGCDLNTSRRLGPGGQGGEEARDMAGPLHLCCQWGLESVVQTLVEHGAAINQRDVEGKTPIHVAIHNQHSAIITLLLCHPNIDLSARDKSGLTPFATALTCRNNKAAQAILDKLPTAADQSDSKGRNFLHTAIQKNDMESVLFLLSIRVDVNSRVQDSNQTPPLHLAAETGSEMLVRSLILAGARADDRDARRRTAIHVAAEAGHASVVSALISNGANFDAADSDGANALHVAMREAHSSVVHTLLVESRCDAEAMDLRGRSPLHVLAKYAKENAAAICEMFLEFMPEYPLDKPDLDGNSALLLAYMKGSGNLCRALVKAGACLGCMNNDGVTIFNYQVATKQLLCRLLDHLSQEPPWSESDICLECGSKFGLTVRKHHCRHCGRILCSKCSDRDVPILKYGLNKPVRVCGVCFDVLQVGCA